MISYTNKVLNTMQQNICVSRPRRFGKSMAADMLTAYYSRGCDSFTLFQGLHIGASLDFTKYLNQYDTISLNIQEFLSQADGIEGVLDLLRRSVLLAYMTGILPIKKYGTHSALNMFDEFSMLNPGPLASFVGFTEDEVIALCEQYYMDMDEMKTWYDGYGFEEVGSIYSPKSVISSLQFGKYGNYWNQTETFEALRVYIDMNFEGLKDDVLSMLAGERIPVNVGSFNNDMTTFRTEDDVLTLLVHLGVTEWVREQYEGGIK